MEGQEGRHGTSDTQRQNARQRETETDWEKQRDR